MTALADRQAALAERRAKGATLAFFIAIGSAELMFLSFAVGSALGPFPLRPLEIVLGSTASFALGAGAATLMARRHLLKGSRFSCVVVEGRKKHRVVLFDDYLTIGREIVLREAIESVVVEARGLVLRYKDPKHDGPVLRELSGAVGELEALRLRLT